MNSAEQLAKLLAGELHVAGFLDPFVVVYWPKGGPVDQRHLLFLVWGEGLPSTSPTETSRRCRVRFWRESKQKQEVGSGTLLSNQPSFGFLCEATPRVACLTVSGVPKRARHPAVDGRCPPKNRGTFALDLTTGMSEYGVKHQKSMPNVFF